MKYVLTLPYTRKQIVTSNMYFSLLMVGVGMGIGPCSKPDSRGCRTRGARRGDRNGYPHAGMRGAAVYQHRDSLIYKFGVEKSRIAVIVIFLVPFMIFIAFSTLRKTGRDAGYPSRDHALC